MNELEYRIVETAEAEKLYPAITAGLNDYSGEFDVPDPEAVHLYCYDEQALVGAAVGKIVAPHLSVKWLWVEKAHRGNRIGAALMDGIEKTGGWKRLRPRFRRYHVLSGAGFLYQTGL
jgi:GNAT superfamily N-acetyltransferase